MRNWVAVPVALALAGCGSTVQVAGGTPAASTGESGLGAPVAQPASRAPGAGRPLATSGAQLPGGTDGSGTPARPGIGGTPGGTSGAVDVRRGSGSGYTATQIRVGFSTSNDAGRALGGLGLTVAVADQEQLVRTWLAKVNEEGGIAGRSVVPVFYDYRATGDINTSDQAACETWTKDTRVFAASGVRAGTTGDGDVLTPCLAKAGIPWLAGSGDQHKWRQYHRTMYSTADMSRTREQRVLVESLAAQGFLTKAAKVGVVISDNRSNMSRAVKEGMEPALARLGLRITKRIVISNAWTESSNAELQMYAAGVTHVLFAAPGGAAAAQFMSAADSQRRTYQYGISTQDAPGAAVQALAPQSQLRNARGYGYRPGIDVDANNQPPETAGMRACFGHYRSKGFRTDGLNLAAMAMVCDAVTLLKEALEGQANPTVDMFAAGVARLASRLPVASTFTTRFGELRHDGPGGYRFLRYVTDCSCFRYQGPVRPSW